MIRQSLGEGCGLAKYVVDEAALNEIHRSKTVDEIVQPVMTWLMEHAPYAVDAGAVLEGFCTQLNEQGVPVIRSSTHIRTIHPEWFAVTRVWNRGVGTEEIPRAHGVMESDDYIGSPIEYVRQTGNWADFRIVDGDLPPFRLPEDVVALGCTHYVMAPLRFSDGYMNAGGFVTDHPNGFSAVQMTALRALIPAYRSALEIKALRRISAELLGTYMGKEPVERIMSGQIQRGQSETVNAVIWFSDLRDSTPLSEQLSPDDMLDMLNEYLEAMSDAVYAHGGEVLRFIGDAALSIFRVPEGGSAEDVCRCALEAAKNARRRIEDMNMCRSTRTRPAIRYGIGLHMGEVSYGNIGSPGRLEFTVIGPNANLAARIESMTKTLGHDILISETVAPACADAVSSVGTHTLKGLKAPMELFTVSD